MSERKWTKETSAFIGEDGEFVIEGPGGVVICHRSPWPQRAEESVANAYLFAAAPKLYEALRAMTDFWIYGLDKPKGAKPSAADHLRAEGLGVMAANALSLAESRPPEQGKP